MKRPFHLPPDINAEAEEVRYTRAAFPHFAFLNVDDKGGILCSCGAIILAPLSWNHVTGREEVMMIVPGCYGGHAFCPSCGIEFSVTRKQARKHNDYIRSLRAGLQK